MSVEEAKTILSNISTDHRTNVPIGLLHPNPWNPNRMDDATYEAEKQSIREFGFIDPCIVWPHPEIDGEWEIVDGDHRRRAAIEEGLETVDITILNGLTPAQARRLTIILNETRGNPDVALMGKLLVELDELLDHNMELLRAGLPFTAAEMDNLLQIGSLDWDDFQQQSGSRSGGGIGELRQFAVVLGFDKAQRERYDTFVAMLVNEKGDDCSPEDAVLGALADACKSL